MPTARVVRNGGDLVQDIIVELWRAYPRFQPARALALHFSGADNCRSRTSRAVAANRPSKATGPAQSTAGAEQNRAQWRAKLARISLIALPVALLALLQVLAKACCGIDLFGAASSWLALAVGLSTSFSCGWLALQLRRDRDFAPRTLDLLSLGALARMDALVQALEASAVSREAE